MKRIIFLLIFLSQNFVLFGAGLPVSVSAESAILMNAESGAILYEKKPHQKCYPASVTKIATALLVLKLRENELDKLIPAESLCIGSVTEEAKQRSNYTLPSYWLVTDCSHMGVKKGEVLSIKDLLAGMLIASADDASNILAYEVTGDIPKFMELVNAHLQEIGCKNTTFNNPHGLHHPNHMTTAYDLAIMTREALKNPHFQKIVKETRFIRPKTNKQESSVMVQTNRLLRSGELYYPKAIGVKTGYTSKARSTLVAAAKDGDRTLIAVLLNVKERKDIFKEAIKLFETAFNQTKVEKVILKSGPQKFTFEVEGADEPVTTFLREDLRLTYYPAEEPIYKAFLSGKENVLPIKAEDVVGEILLKDQSGNILAKAPLLAEKDVDETFFHHLGELFSFKKGKTLIFALLAGAVFFVAAWFISKR